MVLQTAGEAANAAKQALFVCKLFQMLRYHAFAWSRPCYNDYALISAPPD
jgi:hypothetical protein